LENIQVEPNLYYQRKLYALLNHPDYPNWGTSVIENLACLPDPILQRLGEWWQSLSKLDANVQKIADSSDRVNLHAQTPEPSHSCHPISGIKRSLQSTIPHPDITKIPASIRQNPDPKTVFWWFWRFHPERTNNSHPEALIFPTHTILPDCPLHSYQAAVSALTGAMFPEGWAEPTPDRPYLLLFTFSPVQEFIKASRKFVDFWAGSYLLHYLSAKLCWWIADRYGPDAIIVPSLWHQEIIDAWMVKQFDWKEMFREESRFIDPVTQFSDRTSTSLSTAGFPNVITILVPGKDVQSLGDDLAKYLQQEWQKIGETVRDNIREQVSLEAKKLKNDPQWNLFWEAFSQSLPQDTSDELCRLDVERWNPKLNPQFDKICHPGWEWNPLWKAQLSNTWEPYWAAVPLGDPGSDENGLSLTMSTHDPLYEEWEKAQKTLAQSWVELPSLAEKAVFDTFNVGTWWGSLQQRLRLCVQAVKNTRTWEIPAAPGERSTLSGQFSAVHPSLNYKVIQNNGETRDFREGGGISEGSMRLFWQLMAKAYPGLFNGSEKLNALELTKRMAWIYGGVAEDLGIRIKKPVINFDRTQSYPEQKQVEKRITERLIYERFQRFPNLSSIAAARFIHDHLDITKQYWDVLCRSIDVEHRTNYMRLTRRSPSQIPKTDRAINPQNRHRQYYNGAMFSSRWLAEDLNLSLEQTQALRGVVEAAHKNCGFGEGSPSDWWAIVLADGDNMGQYVSGSKLENYSKYLIKDSINRQGIPDELYEGLENTKKRMGPATHIGLNRALLDFSNRLVPDLTDTRFCGKVIYSGGDDVLVALPLEDLPEYLLSLRAAWCGGDDPQGDFSNQGDYWFANRPLNGIPPNRPLFTMGKGATLSTGVVIAHKSVPLPTVLETLWEAEGDRAKSMPNKDGICFRVIYSGGNTLEALMTGSLLEPWWNIVQHCREELSPILYRLAEELPQKANIDNHELFSLAAQVIISRRDENRQVENSEALIQWIKQWGKWAFEAADSSLGTDPKDLGYLLRFSAFWVDKMMQRQGWVKP